MSLSLNGVSIRQDASGLYSLNDVHRASGGVHGKQPSEWLENQQPRALVKDLQRTSSTPVLSVRNKAGTYACEELLSSYANWLGGEVAKSVNESLGLAVVTFEYSRREFLFGKDIVERLFEGYEVIPQFPVLDGTYFIDWYIPELNIAIEHDGVEHLSMMEEDKVRQEDIERELGCKFLRYKDF